VITASAARSALRRKARADEIRRQVDAALRQAAREERQPPVEAEAVEVEAVEVEAVEVEAVEVEAVESADVLRPVRPGRRRMNRHARRAARRRGCLARYTASPADPAIHEPENCDGTCRAGELFSPFSARSPVWVLFVILLACQFTAALHRPKCLAAPASDELCDCGAHYTTDRPSRIGLEAQLTEAQRRAHEHHFGWVLAMWQATVWKPEAAAELARLRPDDRPTDSAWARLRPVLEGLGLLRSQRDHGPPGAGGVAVLCHPRTGPPVLAGAGSRAC
jgi:hypothetical protein